MSETPEQEQEQPEAKISTTSEPPDTGDVCLILRKDGGLQLYAPQAMRGGMVDVDKFPSPESVMFMSALFMCVHDEKLMEGKITEAFEYMAEEAIAAGIDPLHQRG